MNNYVLSNSQKTYSNITNSPYYSTAYTACINRSSNNRSYLNDGNFMHNRNSNNSNSQNPEISKFPMNYNKITNNIVNINVNHSSDYSRSIEKLNCKSRRLDKRNEGKQISKKEREEYNNRSNENSAISFANTFKVPINKNHNFLSPEHNIIYLPPKIITESNPYKKNEIKAIIKVIFKNKNEETIFEYKRKSYFFAIDKLFDLLSSNLEEMGFMFEKQDLVLSFGTISYIYKKNSKEITLPSSDNMAPFHFSSCFNENYQNNTSTEKIKKKKFLITNDKSYKINLSLEQLEEYINSHNEIPELVIENEFCKVTFYNLIIIIDLNFNSLILNYLEVGIDCELDNEFINKKCEVVFILREKKNERDLDLLCDELGGKIIKYDISNNECKAIFENGLNIV